MLGSLGWVSAAVNDRPAAIGCGSVMIVSLLTIATGTWSMFDSRPVADQISSDAATSWQQHAEDEDPTPRQPPDVRCGLLFGLFTHGASSRR